MDKSLKQQLLEVVEDIYVRALKEKYAEYKNLTCLEVIDHLNTIYYKITPSDLKLNTAWMNALHNINKLLESIIEKIDTDVDFNNSGKVP